MAKNASLNKANKAKQDEFYTQIGDIERELKHYIKHFRGKTIFCNCDDPEESNFWTYFRLNFYQFGLKKLISTHYEETKPSYKLEIVAKETALGEQTAIPEVIRTPLKQNGDFRSPECIEILKEADIVITNPPFSLFKQYIPLLIEHGKSFVVIGGMNAMTYKEIFPLLQTNQIWLGYNSGDMAFIVPDYYEARDTRYWVDEDGKKWRSLGNIEWYTNLDIDKRHEEMLLYRTYNPNDYPRYDNYDAIEVSKTANIPVDYNGAMGVPITFMSKYNPDQFEIIGATESEGKGFSNGLWNENSGVAQAMINGKKVYKRIFIRHRKVDR